MESKYLSEINDLKYCVIRTCNINMEKIDINNFNDLFKYFSKYARNNEDYKMLGKKLYTENENKKLDNPSNNYILDLFGDKLYYRYKSCNSIIKVIRYFSKKENLLVVLDVDLYKKDKDKKLMSDEKIKTIRLHNLNEIILT